MMETSERKVLSVANEIDRLRGLPCEMDDRMRYRALLVDAVDKALSVGVLRDDEIDQLRTELERVTADMNELNAAAVHLIQAFSRPTGQFREDTENLRNAIDRLQRAIAPVGIKGSEDNHA